MEPIGSVLSSIPEPQVEGHVSKPRSYRVDMKRKIYVAHSYGGLLGAYILLTEPTMFERYVISSPSLWFDNKVMLSRARAWRNS